LKKDTISPMAVRRLPKYYRHLVKLQRKGVKHISSAELGVHTGVAASQIRQDLSCCGEFGCPGRGYNVKVLQSELAKILGMTNGYTAIVVGAGRIGKALLAHFPFKKYGITITAVYDVDQRVVGKTLFGIPVYHVDALAKRLEEQPVNLCILTVPAEAVYELTEVLSIGKVQGIWNYTNAELPVCDGGPIVENVHLFDSLFSLCCMVTDKAGKNIGNEE